MIIDMFKIIAGLHYHTGSVVGCLRPTVTEKIPVTHGHGVGRGSLNFKIYRKYILEIVFYALIRSLIY